MEGRLLIAVGRWRIPYPPARHDECPKVSRDYPLKTRPGTEALSNGRNGTGRTHVENLEDQIEVLFPTGNRIFIAHRVEESGGHIPFALLDNLLLYLRHLSVIWRLISESLGVRIAGSAHVVSRWIASSTA